MQIGIFSSSYSLSRATTNASQELNIVKFANPFGILNRQFKILYKKGYTNYSKVVMFAEKQSIQGSKNLYRLSVKISFVTKIEKPPFQK